LASSQNEYRDRIGTNKCCLDVFGINLRATARIKAIAWEGDATRA
jgi:hypothetical protein